MNQQITPLVVAFTPNYFIPAITCLHSIFVHSSQADSFEVICLMSEALPQAQVDALQQFAGSKAAFRFVHLKGCLGDVYVDERYTEAASYRLLLPEILADYDKVLYVDCDMIIRQDLAALYRNTNLGTNYLAGVREATLPFQEEYVRQLGCEPGQYINSGFLLMNLALMRADGLSKRLLEALKVDYLEFPDQDVLNQVCKGRILALPPCYNSIRTFFLPQYESAFLTYYSPEELAQVKRAGNVHFTGGKPWNTFTVEFATWWHYYQQLPRAISAMWQENKRLYWFYRFYRTQLGGSLVEMGRNVLRKMRK